MRYALILVFALALNYTYSQTEITESEVRTFMESFFQTVQFEQRADRENRIAAFLDKKSQDQLLEEGYILKRHSAFKIAEIDLPNITIFASKEAGQSWDFKLTFQLTKEDSNLVIQGKEDTGKLLSFVYPWQKEEAIDSNYTSSDISYLNQSLKSYLQQNFPIEPLRFDTAKFTGKWQIESFISHNLGDEFPTDYSDQIHWFGGYQFSPRNEFLFYPFADFSSASANTYPGNWSFFGNYLLLLNGRQSQFEYFYIREQGKDFFEAHTLERGDTLIFRFANPVSIQAKQIADTLVADFNLNLDSLNLNLLSPPKYQKIYSFSKPFISVKFGGMNGLINYEGKEMVPPIYEEIHLPTKSTPIIAQKGQKYYAIDSLGNTTLMSDLKEDELLSNPVMDALGVKIGPRPNEKVGSVTVTGDTIIPFVYDFMRAFSPSYYQAFKAGKQGIIRKDGQTILEPIYDLIEGPDYPIKAIQLQKKRGLFHVEEERWILPIEFDRVSVSGQYVTGERDSSIEIFDLAGEPVLIPGFNLVENFGNGYFKIRQADKYGVVNRDGQLVISATFDEIEQVVSDTFKVMQNDKWGIRGINQNLVIEPAFDQIRSGGSIWSRNYSQTPLVYTNEGKQGLLGWDGKAITPPIYDRIKSIEEGSKLIIVQKNGYFGLIDDQGEEKGPFIYDHVDSFNNGFYPVYLYDKMGLLDADGQIVIPAIFEELKFVSDGTLSLFSNIPGIISFKWSGKWGLFKLPE